MGVEDEDLVAAGACPWVRGLIATILVTGWDGQDRERAGRAAVLSRVLWGVLSGPPVVVPPVERAEAWGVVEDVESLVGLLGSCPGGLGVVDARRSSRPWSAGRCASPWAPPHGTGRWWWTPAGGWVIM